MVTPDTLLQIMPRAGDKARIFCGPLNRAMQEFGIDSPKRQAAFLAQVDHESGQLRYVKELWGPTAAQERYEPPGAKAADLGNTMPGDGFRFRGRGLIQVTGRANYGDCGRALGLDLISRPELLELPEHAARSAAWFWQAHGCNELADEGDFIKLTRRINGGTNGLQDRIALHEKAQTAIA